MKKNKKLILLILFLLLQMFFWVISVLISIEIPVKTKEKKTELILEHKYTLELVNNGNAKLTGGVGGLYGGNGEKKSQGEIIYDEISNKNKQNTEREEKYKEIMENLLVTKLIAVRKDFRREPDYIGYIEKDTEITEDEEIKKIKELKNKERTGYFYSSDTDNIIKFNVSIEEIQERYGKDIVEKMTKPEKVIDWYGLDNIPVDEWKKIMTRRTFFLYIFVNCLFAGGLFLKKLISNHK